VHIFVMRRACVTGLIVLVFGHGQSLRAQEPAPGDELAQHLATLKAQVEDTSLAIGQREALVQEMAGTLDRAARGAVSADQSQERWGRAIGLLDEFNSQNPGHPITREFQLQSAVYRWAQGQGWREAGNLNPGDSRARREATAALDDAIVRLRSISAEGVEKVLADNVRFRLARALADRAGLEPMDSPNRRSRESDALALLQEPMTEAGLRGFSSLLKADLLLRGSRIDEAAAELDAASRADPPPPEREILDVRIPVLIGQKKFKEAEAAITASQLDLPGKDLELVELRLAELTKLAPGNDRFAVEQDMFRLIKALRQGKTNEARLGLLALAQSGIDPDPRNTAEIWDILAEAQEVRGDAVKAGALELRAARRAEEQGQAEAAAGFRLRSGGFLFQAGRYAEADALLSRVADEPRAGAFRPKAGMLRAMARGRALAGGAPGVTASTYAEALQKQIVDFPADPATDEARWLLGTLFRATGEPGKAEPFWTAIAQGSPRWLDARLAVADIKLSAVESELLSGERHLIVLAYQRAESFLIESAQHARNEREQVELLLAQARLNLVPTAGKAPLALSILERLGGMGMTPQERYRARLARMIALVQVGPPYLDAEREAQTHASWADPSAHWAFIDAIRLIDQCASFAVVDLHQRRLGLVLRLLVQPVLQNPDDEKWTAEERSGIKLRLTRAYLFLGDERNARSSFQGWAGLSRSAPDDLLRDLADTYNRLEVYELAIDVQRLRLRNLQTGSPSWFEARYGLALAYFHAGHLKEAAQLIDATAILHPELGGGAVQKKFIKLRQRLGVQP
jgi:tetratricopeptide (TPR) repeat protein